MQALRTYTQDKLKMRPEQVQIFTPLPSTYSALMYYTETDPTNGNRLFVEKDTARKEKQKEIITDKSGKTARATSRKLTRPSSRPRSKPKRRA